MTTPNVLIIDDDTELCELLVEYLGREGFAAEAVHDGETGAVRALASEWALVILDVMLPRRSGLDVLRHVRATSPVPVIMLTARGDEVDRVVGLELGADDYLPKPFSPRELVARMRAVLRRGPNVLRAAGDRERMVRLGDVVLDTGARTVRRGGEDVHLTGAEYALLEALVRAAGTVVGREALSRAVLGRRPGAFDRSLDVHASGLRRKLGPLPEGGERIKAVRGSGYFYVAPPETPETGS
jgi:two-component system response regulator CpxR